MPNITVANNTTMTFHPILYSLETIAHLQSQQKMIYQNGLLQVDGRYLRDFRRNWQGFSRYELIQPIRIYFYHVLNLCYISQTTKNQKSSKQLIYHYLNDLLKRVLIGLRTMLYTYGDFPALHQLIRQLEQDYEQLIKILYPRTGFSPSQFLFQYLFNTPRYSVENPPNDKNA